MNLVVHMVNYNIFPLASSGFHHVGIYCLLQKLSGDKAVWGRFTSSSQSTKQVVQWKMLRNVMEPSSKEDLHC